MTNEELYLSLNNSDKIELNERREDANLVIDQINLELFIRAAGLRNEL